MLPLMGFPTCISAFLLVGAWVSGTLPTASILEVVVPHAIITGGPHEIDFDDAVSDPDDVTAWFSPCEDVWNDGRVAVCDVRTFELASTGDPLLVNAGQNGGISVEGWDRKGIRVLARVKARARTHEAAAEIAAAVKVTTRGTRVTSSGPATNRNQHWCVEYRIFVPKTCDLALTTLNGPIRVANVSGTMDLSAINGPISLGGLGGAVQARAQNGPLSVKLTGHRWVGAGLDAATENGPLTLRLPKDYSARLETGTVNGPTDMDYPVQLRSVHGKRIVATLGSGGPPVRVVTTNGPFSFRESD